MWFSVLRVHFKNKSKGPSLSARGHYFKFESLLINKCMLQICCFLGNIDFQSNLINIIELYVYRIFFDCIRHASQKCILNEKRPSSKTKLFIMYLCPKSDDWTAPSHLARPLFKVPKPTREAPEISQSCSEILIFKAI